MPTCYLLVGLPGLGKSHYISKLDNAFVYSTDTYIEQQAQALESSYTEIFDKYIDKAKTRMNALLDIAFLNRVDIVWDQTNLALKKRAKIVNRMKQERYNVNCIHIVEPTNYVDIAVWNTRLFERKDKYISHSVIKQMKSYYIPPSIEEGFDSLQLVNMYGECID